VCVAVRRTKVDTLNYLLSAGRVSEDEAAAVEVLGNVELGKRGDDERGE
jgi:hypothetical protein